MITIIFQQIMKRMNEEEWADSECPYKACQTAMTVLA